jgi:hypothetical protein
MRGEWRSWHTASKSGKKRVFLRSFAHTMLDPKIILIAGAAVGPWPDLPQNAQAVVVSYAHLTLHLIKNILPDVIVLPLFGAGFDAMDVIIRLASMGYSGRVLVTGPALPRPALILRELAAFGPGMIITLISPP